MLVQNIKVIASELCNLQQPGTNRNLGSSAAMEIELVLKAAAAKAAAFSAATETRGISVWHSQRVFINTTQQQFPGKFKQHKYMHANKDPLKQD